jgi:2-haloacid dehalogenase
MKWASAERELRVDRPQFGGYFRSPPRNGHRRPDPVCRRSANFWKPVCAARVGAYRTTTLTFDCYGTLIDWEGGACRALRDIYGYSDVTDDALIDLFLRADARLVKKNIFPYSEVLMRVAQSVAESLGVRSDPARETWFASSLPTWPAFEETIPCLTGFARRFRLAIISNIDDNLLSQTIKRLGAPFEVIVTSEQSKSYKPDLAIFDRAVKLIGEPPTTIIHIAQGRCKLLPPGHSECEAFGSIDLRALTMEAARNRIPLFQI